jgi:predicted metal-dependent hydrolase
MAKTSGKIIDDPQIGQVLFRKSTKARRISIRVHPVRGVTVSVPYMVPYMAAEAFFRLKRQWVIETIERQKEKYKDVKDISREDIEQMRCQAKAEIPARLSDLAARYGFVYNKVAIKNNSSNWGSCSIRNNININLKIVRLPSVLQDYILLHELCHLRHHDHGHAFHLLLEHLLTDNTMKLMAEGDEYARMIAAKAAVSKSRFPLDYIMSREIISKSRTL